MPCINVRAGCRLAFMGFIHKCDNVIDGECVC